MKSRTAIVIGVTVWALATLATILLPLPAHAEEDETGYICTSRVKAVKKLALKYQEAPVNMGLARNGAVIEVFATKDGATFTLTMTMPDGVICMMAAGENWETVKFKLDDAI